jgi:hypothetical protein
MSIARYLSTPFIEIEAVLRGRRTETLESSPVLRTKTVPRPTTPYHHDRFSTAFSVQTRCAKHPIIFNAVLRVIFCKIADILPICHSRNCESDGQCHLDPS